MAIKCGIVGLPNVGKSTLFNALTAAEIPAENYPFCTIEPNIGIVPVPDPRLGTLSDIVVPQKTIPTTMEFVDIAGLVAGASTGEGLGNQFLANIRETNAIAHVVRCFEDDDVTHVSGKIDPIDDIEIINTELALADLESVEKQLYKAEKNAKTNEKEAVAIRDTLLKTKLHLDQGAFRHPLGDLVAYLALYGQFRDSSDRDGFCARHYLEPRTMYEILNVKEQLEAIVSGLGVPVSGGGPTTHYLCAVGRGLIQFICVAAGPGRYRSPTAGNIFIHPGSGMYQQPARYIMAGEIMRTARAYARSVSPLTREQVRAISPDLLADLIAVSGDGSKGERRAGRGRRRERAAAADRSDRRPRSGSTRDAAAQMHLLGQVFAVTEPRSKRPLVTLPWQDAAPIARRAGRRSLAEYRSWRGRITLDGAEIMAGARLEALFEVLAKIDPAHRIDAGWPRDTMHVPQDSARLLGCLGHLLAISARRPEARKLGFIALQTDANGGFWLSQRRNLQNAVADSLASLEALADAPRRALDDAQQATVSAVYRRVANLL